ncbi:MAG: arginine--tRNA ligase [Aquificae bacterium]|nr:arginine--tRNA ligase [Aquificota bacterium]
MKEILIKALRSALGELPEGTKVEKPKEEAHGDLATNVAFLLARKLRKPPHEIARELASRLSESPYFKSVEAVKGFINVRFSEELLKEEFSRLILEGGHYFKQDLGKGERVQLEFVSANPTGPLHLGHGRGAAVGDALARIMSFLGWRVEREYYVNDAGRQVYLLGLSVYYRYLELCPSRDERLFEQVKQRFEQDGYRGEYVKELAGRLYGLIGDALCGSGDLKRVKELLLERESLPLYYLKRYEQKSPEELCADYALDLMLKEIKEDLKLMGVEFDRWFSERSLYDEGLVDEVIELLKKKGFVYEKDGALWLATSRFGDDKDRVLRRSDGSYTYFASDVAYHYQKARRGYDRVIDVWGADHHGYVPRVRAALKMLGLPDGWLEVLLVQMVRLFRKGQEVKMSKRTGSFVPLRELLNEVGPDAVRFTFLTKRSDTPLDFDVELVKEKSSENPVFYVQYAHARISGILREFKKHEGELPTYEQLAQAVRNLTDEEGLKLIKEALFFKDELAEAALRREPHRVTYYLIELASAFHPYYNRHRILGAPTRELALARLALVTGLREVFRLGLNLLGVTAPERM